MGDRRRYRPYLRSSVRRARLLRRDATPAEKKLWILFLRDLPQKFTRQKPLGPYIVDFYCSSARLVVEIDGDSHFDPDGAKYDAIRTEALRRLDLRVLRFTNLEIAEEFEGVCERIRATL